MFTKKVTVTNFYSLIVLVGIALSSTHGFAQGTQGPDTAGVAIGSVGKNAVLGKDLIDITAICMTQVVDSLVKTVSNGNVQITGYKFSKYQRGIDGWDFWGTKIVLSTNKGCVFEAESRQGFTITSDLTSCPKEFTNLKTRNIWLQNANNNVIVPMISYKYTPQYNVDAMGSITSRIDYASNVSVFGGVSGDLEFQGGRPDSEPPYGRTVPNGVTVFRYPVLKHRECLQTGLSSLAK